MTAPTTASLQAVSSSGAGSAFAVGANGTIVGYNGSSWSNMTSPTTTSLRAVWAHTPTDVFAVGWGATLLHFDGGTWTTMPAPALVYDVNGVWGTAANDVFAVGSGGKILHYNGRAWRKMDSPTTDALYSVGGNGPADVFASGANGVVLHFDGLGWGKTTTQRNDTFYATSGSYAVPFANDLLEWQRDCSAEADYYTCNNGIDEDCDGLYDCGDPDCAGQTPCNDGGQCLTADTTALACNITTPGTTQNGTRKLSTYACDSVAEHGRETIYKIGPLNAGDVTVALTSNKDLDLVVLAAVPGGGCDPRNPYCIDASSTGAMTDTITFTAEAGKSYYVIVEGYGSAVGAFTLMTTCP